MWDRMYVCVLCHHFAVEQQLGCLVARRWRICLPMQETQETQVRSLGPENPLEKKMAACSSVLAWEIPWTEDPGGLQSLGLQRVRHNWTHGTLIAQLKRGVECPAKLRARALAGTWETGWRAGASSAEHQLSMLFLKHWTIMKLFTGEKLRI